MRVCGTSDLQFFGQQERAKNCGNQTGAAACSIIAQSFPFIVRNEVPWLLQCFGRNYLKGGSWITYLQILQTEQPEELN